MKMQDESSVHQIKTTFPLISLVMTAYNATLSLRTALTAALAQSDSNFEVVLVDDGSTDDTRSICNAITDPRFRYIPKPRLGRSRALNVAVAEANGTYIAINDADDLSHPDRLSRCRDVFASNPDAVIVGTDYWVTSSLPRQDTFANLFEAYPCQDKCHEISVTELFRRNPLLHSSVMFPKQIWHTIGGYDEDLSVCIDYDFYLRALGVGKIVCLPRKLVLQYRNEDSFFRKKSVLEYISTLLYIKRRARKVVHLPMWARVYDVIPLYLFAKLYVHRITSGRWPKIAVSQEG